MPIVSISQRQVILTVFFHKFLKQNHQSISRLMPKLPKVGVLLDPT